MKRKFLLTVASAPLLLMAAGQARAVDSITTSTSTPVSTATATNNAPDDIDIAAGGSIGLTVPGIAVTVNSSNVVTNEGEIGFTAINNATGIQVQGGNTGSVTNTGSILVTDNYTAAVDQNTGLNELPYAEGTNRVGIQVVAGTSPGAFNGFIANYGTITVHGDNSYGVAIDAPMTLGFRSLEYTAATSTAAGFITTGTITVVGGEPATSTTSLTPPVIGFYVAPTGSLGGDVTLAAVSATGYKAQAVDIEGSVGGAVNFSGSVTATGYATTTRSSYPSIGVQYTSTELEQGGPAVTIADSVTSGVVLSSPPLTAAVALSITNDFINSIAVPQDLQATATITSFGSAPAMIVGSASKAIEIGVINTANNTVLGPDGVTNVTGAFGLANQGSITGNGVFDQVNYPYLPGAVSGTALQIGGANGFAAVIDGGIYNSGTIEGQAYQANATAIHFTAGGSTPQIVNDGLISGSSLQQTSATTVSILSTTNVASTVNLSPVSVYGILIDQGATLNSITNNSGITANLTGTGGVGGYVGAIIDKSGTLATINNTGSISAQANQTLITAPMPVTTVAVDMSLGTGPQKITQSLSSNPLVTGSVAYNDTVTYNEGQIVNFNGLVYQAVTAAGVAIDPLDYPSFWKEIGAIDPFISGSILMGSGGSSITVSAGTVTGQIINLGTGSTNSLTVAGPTGGALNATGITGAIEEVSGATAEAQVAGTTALTGGGNGTLTISVNNGTLNDLNPHTEYVNSVNVGANGLLLVSADPANGANTKFVTSGASTFAQGAQLGITLLSIPTTLQSTYTVLQTTPGLAGSTLTAGTFGQAAIGTAPWLYSATAAYVPSTGADDPSELQLTVTRKTAAQIGFNAAEASALDAILAAAPANTAIQNALLTQTTEAGLKSVYDQLLPTQGQGLFDALDAAAQAVGSMVGTTPQSATHVGGTSLWLQEVNERVDMSGTSTLGTYTKLFGVVAGYELMGPGGGAAGLTLAYYNANELEDADQIGAGEVASMVEGGAYYRRSIGHFSVAARAAIGYAWFSDTRIFATVGATSATDANSATGTEIQAHSSWGGVFYDGQFTASYEQSFGHFYARPEISADFLELDEDGHSETGGGAGFDLNIAARNSNRLSGQAILVLGREWGQAAWLRTEVSGGFREIFEGEVGDTTANFSGGNAFTLAPDNDRGGWFTAGFAIKGGSQYSYLALEGNIDLRPGEQRYDVRIAGRSIF